MMSWSGQLERVMWRIQATIWHREYIRSHVWRKTAWGYKTVMANRFVKKTGRWDLWEFVTKMYEREWFLSSEIRQGKKELMYMKRMPLGLV